MWKSLGESDNVQDDFFVENLSWANFLTGRCFYELFLIGISIVETNWEELKDGSLVPVFPSRTKSANTGEKVTTGAPIFKDSEATSGKAAFDSLHSCLEN